MATLYDLIGVGGSFLPLPSGLITVGGGGGGARPLDEVPAVPFCSFSFKAGRVINARLLQFTFLNCINCFVSWLKQ